MKPKILIGIAAAALALIWLGIARRPEGIADKPNETLAASLQPLPKTNAAVPMVSNGVPTQSLSKLKCQWSDFTDAEKREFGSNFVSRYKPALAKWSAAFSGRVPISPDAVAASNFVVRVGTRPTYREYIFVVDGITLGIQDSKGVARVDYLNAPQQTHKLAALPDGSQTPISATPVSKNDMVGILFAEGGAKFTPNEIRVIPSGYSGSLNGGALVNVGGDPDNAASWKYDMVFDADGKLAYYLKGR